MEVTLPDVGGRVSSIQVAKETMGKDNWMLGDTLASGGTEDRVTLRAPPGLSCQAQRCHTTPNLGKGQVWGGVKEEVKSELSFQ